MSMPTLFGSLLDKLVPKCCLKMHAKIASLVQSAQLPHVLDDGVFFLIQLKKFELFDYYNGGWAKILVKSCTVMFNVRSFTMAGLAGTLSFVKVSSPSSLPHFHL